MKTKLGLLAGFGILCLKAGLLGAQEERTAQIQQIEQQLQQLSQEEEEWSRAARSLLIDAETLHAKGQWRRPLDNYLTAVPFPMPPVLDNDETSPVYVEVLQVSRADALIGRNYPKSRQDGYPYYEIKVRLLNSWGGYREPKPGCAFALVNPFGVGDGQVIRLLWTPRRLSALPEERSTQIWKVGERYLLFGIRGCALEMPVEEQNRRRMFLGFRSMEEYQSYLRKGGEPFPPVEKRLFLVGERYFGFLWPPWIPSDSIEAEASIPIESICSSVPYGVLANPPKELLQLLEEESVVLRLSGREKRCEWARQRAQDPKLPVWKRQRMVLYSWRVGCLPCELEKPPALPAGPPDQLLGWLQRLEPEVRAFGLQTFPFRLWGVTYDPKECKQLARRLLWKLDEFLDARQPVVVRREAAWIFADYSGSFHSSLRSVPVEVVGGALDLSDLVEWRERLKVRAREETDKITRLLLEAAQCETHYLALRKEISALGSQLRELKQR